MVDTLSYCLKMKISSGGLLLQISLCFLSAGIVNWFVLSQNPRFLVTVRLELYIILLIQKKTDLCWHRMVQQGIFPRFLRILQPSYLEILEKLWINDQLTLEISEDFFSKLLKGPTTYTENKLVFLQKLHLNLMVLRFYVRQ